MKLKGKLLGGAFVLAVIGIVTFNFFDFMRPKTQNCYFPQDLLVRLMDTDTYDVKFYNAEVPGFRKRTLMAVSSLNGADVAGSMYQLYASIIDTRALIFSIPTSSAEKLCSNTKNTERYAVTFERDLILRMLRENGATGILLSQERSDNGEKTLSIHPAKLHEGRIIRISGGSTNQFPCPSYCGQSPSSDYLCPME